MSEGGHEVARAFVTIVPAFEKGIRKNITTEIAGIGTLAGGGFMSAYSSAIMGAIGGVTAQLTSIVTSAISSSMDSAIKRVDTLNNYPRVMQNLGFSAEEADNSISMIDEHLQGLPTTVDALASSVQALSPMFDDLDDATEVALAMNDALLAGGASAAEAESAMTQYTQMMAKGKPDMQDWRALQSAMPGQLDQIAKALLGPTSNAQQLYEALQEGTVTMDDFNRTVVELDENGANGFASFEEQARDATGGIATQLANLRTAVVKAVANVLQVIQPYIQPAVDWLKGIIKRAGEWVAQFIQTLKDNIDFEAFANAFNTLKEAWQSAFPEGGGSAASWGEAVANAINKLPGLIEKLAPLVHGLGVAVQWLTDHAQQVVPVLFGVVIAFKGMQVAKALAPMISGLAGSFGKLGSKIPAVGKAAGASASQILALGASLLMVGGAIALAGLGFKMMAEAAVQLADAGGVAIAVFAGMVAAIIGIGAALLIAAPGLTAAAPGLLAFGAAMLMVAGAIAIVTVAIAYLVEVIAANAPQLVELMQGAADAFVTACDGIAEAVSKVVTAIADGATQIIDAVSRLVDSVGNAISNVLDSLAGVFDSIGNAALNAGKGMDMLVNALIKLTNETKLVDLAESCRKAASGIKEMSEAAGDGAGLNAVANAIQLLGTMGMVAATSTMMLAQGMMMISANAATAQAAITAFVAAIVSSGSQLNAAAASIRTFAGSQMVIQTFSRNAIASLKAFGIAAQTYSNQAASAVRVAMASIAATVANTRLRMQRIEVGKLPHFRFEGQFNAQTGQTPNLRVDWYAGGGVFGEPTIIGVGDARSPEIVTPEDVMQRTFENTLDAHDSGLANEVRALREDVKNIKLYLDGNVLVGGIADRMDTRLGVMQTSAARGF